MNEDILKGKWNQFKGDAKIWWGKTIGDSMAELEGNTDKITGWIQEKKGIVKEQAEQELEEFARAKEAFSADMAAVGDKIRAEWDKFTQEDIAEIEDSFTAWADKIKEKYNESQEKANAQIKKFMSEFY